MSAPRTDVVLHRPAFSRPLLVGRPLRSPIRPRWRARGGRCCCLCCSSR